MGTKSFNVKKLTDPVLRNAIPKADDDVIYCEMQYQRDKSSFAGVALKITDEKDVMTVRPYGEKVIYGANKFEKVYIGCEQDYVNSVKEVFCSEKRDYGIEVFFLVYSDVRSSQIIFEELMMNVDKDISSIRERS